MRDRWLFLPRSGLVQQVRQGASEGNRQVKRSDPVEFPESDEWGVSFHHNNNDWSVHGSTGARIVPEALSQLELSEVLAGEDGIIRFSPEERERHTRAFLGHPNSGRTPVQFHYVRVSQLPGHPPVPPVASRTYELHWFADLRDRMTEAALRGKMEELSRQLEELDSQYNDRVLEQGLFKAKRQLSRAGANVEVFDVFNPSNALISAGRFYVAEVHHRIDLREKEIDDAWKAAAEQLTQGNGQKTKGKKEKGKTKSASTLTLHQVGVSPVEGVTPRKKFSGLSSPADKKLQALQQ